MWRFRQENIDKLMVEGRIVFTKTGMPAAKRYLDELEGMRGSQSLDGCKARQLTVA